jgi:hypothetical protein
VQAPFSAASALRPLEASHKLTISGNLFVEGGGVPVVPAGSNSAYLGTSSAL